MSERRQNRAGIAIAASEDLRQALLPLLAVAVISGGVGEIGEMLQRLVTFGALGCAIAAVTGYVRWSTTTYRAGGGAVGFKTGVFKVSEKSIPLDRLQSLDVSQGPVQRLFGVRQVRLQAAGSGKTAEILLNALSDREIAELQAAVAQSPALHADADDAVTALPARRLTTGRLLLAGVTSAQIGFLVPLAAGAASAVDDLSDPLIDWARDGGDAVSVTTAVAVVGAVLGAAWVVAFVATVIGFGGFALRRRGDRLEIERGYIVRRVASVPVARIQAVRLVDGVLRQPLGMTQLRLETAGYADERADARTLFPLLRRDEVRGFLSELLPELDAPLEPLTPPPGRALRRYVWPPALAGLGVGALGAVALEVGWTSAGVLALTGAAIGAGWGVLRYRAAGVALPPGALVVRSRRLARSTVIARRTSVDIRLAAQNPLQRRAALADLRFAIASGHKFGAKHVERRDALGALVTLAPPRRP